MKLLNNSDADKGHGGDRLTRSPLTPLQEEGMMTPTSWPGGAYNTPGRGATCGGR